MPTESELRSRRDSWPPTLLHLASGSSISSTKARQGDPIPLLDGAIDEDPLTYFLTPTPSVEDGGDDDFDEPMLDFDAGIGADGFAHDAIRSVSPSTLDGLAKYKPVGRTGPFRRGWSPETDSDMSADEDDGEDDGEDYIRFPPRSAPRRLLSMEERRPQRPRSPLSSLSFPAPSSSSYSSSPRGRPRFAPRSPPRKTLRPGHVWRVPSPDVWSIEEEDEGEDAEMKDGPNVADKGKTKKVPQEGEAAKPWKKVRFVLPGEN